MDFTLLLTFNAKDLASFKKLAFTELGIFVDGELVMVSAQFTHFFF